MSTIQSQMIDFPCNGHTTPGYLAQPAGPGPHPAIVCIQEWWGLVPHIKAVADRFAAAGFVVLAPDLYHGQAASEPDEARKLAMALDIDKALDEIAAAARYLVGLPAVGPKKVGVVGWCMGGAAALGVVARGDSAPIAASVAFYGRPVPATDVAKIDVPVLGLYGEADAGIPVAGVRDFEAALADAGVTHEIHIYPDAPHAFFNDTRPSYRPDIAADAWERTLGWFRAHLSG